MPDSRPPGRPPLNRADPSVKVCFSLPGRQYDDLYARSQRERVSVGDLIRRKLADDEDDSND
jgi:hypothetical protein